MKQELVIEHWLPAPIANGPHGHWAQKRKKLYEAKMMAWARTRHAGWKPVKGKARLTVTLVFSQNRRRDTDNLYSRVKGLVDGCKDWIVDDSAEWLELHVSARVEPGRKATLLELETL